MAACEFNKEGKCCNSEMRRALEYSFTKVGRTTVISWEASRFLRKVEEEMGYDCIEQNNCPGNAVIPRTRTLSLSS